MLKQQSVKWGKKAKEKGFGRKNRKPQNEQGMIKNLTEYTVVSIWSNESKQKKQKRKRQKLSDKRRQENQKKKKQRIDEKKTL